MNIIVEKVYPGDATPGLSDFAVPEPNSMDESVEVNATIQIPAISLINGLKAFSLLKEGSLSLEDVEILKTIRTAFNVTADVGLRFRHYEMIYSTLAKQTQNYYDYINSTLFSIDVSVLFKGWNYMLIYFAEKGNDFKFMIVGENSFQSLKENPSNYMYCKFYYETDNENSTKVKNIKIDESPISLSSFLSPVEVTIDTARAVGVASLYRIDADTDTVRAAMAFIRNYFKNVYGDENNMVGQLLNKIFVTYDLSLLGTKYKIYGPNLFIPYNIELVYNAVSTDFGIVSDDENRSVYGIFASDFVNNDSNNPVPVSEFKGFYAGDGNGVPVNVTTTEELHLKKLKSNSSEGE